MGAAVSPRNDRDMSETEAPLISKATARLDAGARRDVRIELTPDGDGPSQHFLMSPETARPLFADLARIFASFERDEADYWRRYFRSDEGR